MRRGEPSVAGSLAAACAAGAVAAGTGSAVATVVALLLIAFGGAAWGAPGATPAEPVEEEGPPATPPATDGPGDAEPDGTPYSRTAEARRQWRPVVTGFAKRFPDVDRDADAAGSDDAADRRRAAREWRRGLKPYVTTAVRRQLATVDVRNVPEGRFTEFEVLRHGEEQLAAQVIYDEGWALVLYVIFDGEDWRVYRYDRWQE